MKCIECNEEFESAGQTKCFPCFKKSSGTVKLCKIEDPDCEACE